MVVQNREKTYSEDFFVQNRLNGQINLCIRFIWPEIKAQTNKNIKWTKFDLTFQILFDLECVKILFLFMKTCVYKCYTFVTCQNWTELSR